jgi:Tfp pilus assembly protein PilF
VALAVYANSLGGALLYDDVNAIRNNALVRTGDVVGILGTPSWWGEGPNLLWRPLTTLTFALDHALHGLEPFGYHLVNVVLHAAVTVLVLSVLAAVPVALRTAVAAALLFAVHPIHTEAVASVVGRAELLAAAGFFLAWRFWLAGDAAAGSRKRWAWTVAAAVAYFLAMCGKEIAVALPAVLVFADLLRRQESSWSAFVRRAPRHAALVAVTVGFVVLRSTIIGQVTPTAELLDNPLVALPLVSRLLTAIEVIGLYALRLAFPLWLSADYSFDQVRTVTTPFDGGFLGGLAVLVGTVVVGWWTWRRRPAVALGLGVLGLTFGVVSNLFFLIGTIMGERLVYLPSVGFCLALAGGLAALGGEREGAATGVPGRWSPVFVAPLAAIVLLYGARTVARNVVWREPIGFYEAMVADAPRSARSHRELGTVLGEIGRFDEMHRAFERSLAIKPEDPNTLYNYGNALSIEQRYDAAADAYRRAIAVNPLFVQAFENLGNAESMRGDQQAALAALRRALELTPDSPYLLMNIANTHFRAGSVAEARATYEQALARAPAASDILVNYGAFLYTQGDFAAAAGVLERVPPPPPPRALVALAESYRMLGRMAEAQATRATAERLYPSDPGVRQLMDYVRRGAMRNSGSP